MFYIWNIYGNSEQELKNCENGKCTKGRGFIFYRFSLDDGNAEMENHESKILENLDILVKIVH